MSQQELTVQRRDVSGKGAARRLRLEGKVPAVLYGHGQAPQNLTVDYKAFTDMIAHKGTKNMLVLGGDGGNETAFIKDLQRHPVRGTVQAIDLIRVSRNEKITVSVPLLVEGEQADIKSGEGVLDQSLHEVQISASAASVPDSITVDISHLEMGGPAMTLADVQLPEGVELVSAPETAVAAVNTPQKDEPVEPTGEADTAEAAEDVPAEEGQAADE